MHEVRAPVQPVGTHEWDLLATALNRYGIQHVAPHTQPKESIPHGEGLFARLATARAVRLREAMILLLLTHPDLDLAARRAIASLEGDVRQHAMFRYVAACALQRMWWTRLQGDLGPRRHLHPAYLEDLGLPSLDVDFGQTTLLALSNLEEEEFGYDAWIGYTSLMDLFLAELIDPTWGRRDARAR